MQGYDTICFTVYQTLANIFTKIADYGKRPTTRDHQRLGVLEPVRCLVIARLIGVIRRVDGLKVQWSLEEGLRRRHFD